jgi:hypothetical protein
MPEPRRFPPPWSVDEASAACFIVRDHEGKALAYAYFEDEPGRRSAAHLMTRDEARARHGIVTWVVLDYKEPPHSRRARKSALAYWAALGSPSAGIFSRADLFAAPVHINIHRISTPRSLRRAVA